MDAGVGAGATGGGVVLFSLTAASGVELINVKRLFGGGPVVVGEWLRDRVSPEPLPLPLALCRLGEAVPLPALLLLFVAEPL